LYEIRKPRSVDPLTSHEMLAARRLPHTKDACDVAMGKPCCVATGLSKLRGGARRNELRANHTHEDGSVRLLVLRGPDHCLRILVDPIDDFEPSSNDGARV
jgi:hypothetical protein